MKSTRELLGYGFAALVLGGGTAYGWHMLVRPPPIPPVPPLAEPAAVASSAPPTAPATVQAPAAPPPIGRPAPLPRAAPAPDPVASPSENQYAQDQAQFYTLQNGCYTAAANNSNGQYPTFQAMACDRYARFAAEHGWNPGTLPAYGQPAPAPPEAVAQQALPQDQPQVVYVVPGVYGHGHRHHQVRQDADGTQPQQQIGPNYPLPPPQQPPPVSQRQQPASKVVRARGTQN